MLRRKLPPSFSILVLFMILVSGGVGCRKMPASSEQQFRELFEGYQLVIVSDLPALKPIERVDISTLQNSYPAESKMTPGRIYVFRKTTATGDQAMSLTVLPKRLAMIGATVTKAPRSSKDLIYVYDGGPIFAIDFEKDGHAGKIFNQSANPKNALAGPEWLILAYS